MLAQVVFLFGILVTLEAEFIYCDSAEQCAGKIFTYNRNVVVVCAREACVGTTFLFGSGGTVQDSTLNCAQYYSCKDARIITNATVFSMTCYDYYGCENAKIVNYAAPKQNIAQLNLYCQPNSPNSCKGLSIDVMNYVENGLFAFADKNEHVDFTLHQGGIVQVNCMTKESCVSFNFNVTMPSSYVLKSSFLVSTANHDGVLESNALMDSNLYCENYAPTGTCRLICGSDACFFVNYKCSSGASCSCDGNSCPPITYQAINKKHQYLNHSKSPKKQKHFQLKH